MSARSIIPQPLTSDDQEIFPLEPGDQLTRDEFERRYAAMPSGRKAELIEGVVYMPPPAVRWDHHGTPHAHLMTWLGVYCLGTPGVELGENSSIRLDLDNEPQPDAAIMIKAGCGGQARFADDGLLEGAPEFVAEVAGSSVSIDTNQKLRAYLRNGVREYLIWRVRDRAIDWFALKHGQYEPLPRTDGIIASEILPGLWLDPEAMIRRPSAVLGVLQKGMASKEYAEFVARLQAAAGPG